MIEWLTLLVLATCAGGLLLFPSYAAAVLLVLSTIDAVTLPVPGGDLSVAHAGILIACPSLALRFLFKRNKIDYQTASSLLFIFIGAAVSCLFAFYAPGVMNSLLKFFSYLIAFYLIAFTHNQNDLKLGFLAALASIGLSILFSVIFVLYSEKPHGIHLVGGFKDWNFYAVFLCVWIPVLWQAAKTGSNEKTKQWLYILAVVILVLLIGTRSKSGIMLLAFTAASMFAVGMAPRRYLLWLIPVGLFGFIYLFSGGSMGERIMNLMQQPRMQERLANNRLALEMFFQNPLVGVGINQYETYAYQNVGNLNFTPVRTDSSFLVLLAECGIFAGLGYCSLILHCITKAWRQASSNF
ncbi:MAG: O-antigen ligase family protein, partial [Taibaiella sp.]|nr:O-antigen ligase family protein [Taibaiella sp.]